MFDFGDDLDMGKLTVDIGDDLDEVFSIEEVVEAVEPTRYVKGDVEVVWLLPLCTEVVDATDVEVGDLLANVENISDLVVDVGGTVDVLLDADESVKLTRYVKGDVEVVSLLLLCIEVVDATDVDVGELVTNVENIFDIVVDVGGTVDVLLNADEATTQETATSSLCAQLWMPHAV